MMDTSKLKRDFEKCLSSSDDEVRDLCFGVRAFVFNKAYTEAIECIKRIVKISSSANTTTANGLILWTLCNGAIELDAISVGSKYVEELVNLLEHNMNSPAPHWLYGGQPKEYLSNTAILYGALQGALNRVDNDKVRKNIIRLREYALNRFLQGGHLISIGEGNERLGELQVCAVPFCMFGAEDRILVESMEEEYQRFFEGSNGIEFRPGAGKARELTLLMSWYYAEKGDVEKGDLIRAKVFYSTALGLEPSPGKQALCTVLVSIVEEVLNRKENQRGQLTILHKPLGTSDPYYTFPHERHPRLPLEGQEVLLNAEILPSFGEYDVALEYSINNQCPVKVPMKQKSADTGARYYSAQIGSLSFGDSIAYKITAHSGQKRTQSEWFSFRTAKWFSCEGIAGAQHTQEGIKVYFNKDRESEIAPALVIKPCGNTAKLLFEFCNNREMCKQGALGVFEAEGFDVRIEPKGLHLLEKGSRKKIASMEEKLVSFLCDGEQIIQARIALNAKQEEKYFGMGERYGCIEYRGLRIDNYVYNQYRSQGMRTYMPSPFYISTEGYGLYLKTNSISVFDFCCELQDTVTLEGYCKEACCELDIYLGEPKEIIKAYIKETGMPELPPVWAFGPWMSSNNWDSQQAVLHQLEMTKKYGIPATVLVIEQWSDEATFYIFNDAKYKVKDGLEPLLIRDYEFPQWGRWPNPRNMVEQLHREGLKVLLWQVPIHKYMGGIAHPQRDEDERVMLEEGYCVRHEDGAPYRIPYGWFAGSLVLDFTNPKARKWWLDKRRYLLEDIGVDGFKTDGGECILGDNLKFCDGTSGREMHNRYVLDYIGAYNHYVKEVKGQGITFSRAGYAGAQKMPMHWAGDERSSWEAFKSSIRAGISAGLSGILFWGWDLAGFHGEIPTAELFIRSAQMAAFCPVMQYHAETKGEFCRDRTPWNIAERTGDERAISLYRKYAMLRMNLLPYIYSEAVRCTEEKEPMMRAMFYDFPGSTECEKLDMQYMFGRSLLVAPVTEEKGIAVRVYLPEGKWHGLYDGKIYDQPGYYDIEAPLDRIPVFARGNSILPLNVDSSLALFTDVGNRTDTFNHLCLDIWLEDRIYESFDFGSVGKVKIELERVGNRITAKVEAQHPVILRFWNEKPPQHVWLQGQKAKGGDIETTEGSCWCYRDNQVLVKVEKACSVSLETGQPCME